MLVHYSVINQTVARAARSRQQGLQLRSGSRAAAARGMGIANLRVMEAGLLADNSREKSESS